MRDIIKAVIIASDILMGVLCLLGHRGWWLLSEIARGEMLVGIWKGEALESPPPAPGSAGEAPVPVGLRGSHVLSSTADPSHSRWASACHKNKNTEPSSLRIPGLMPFI